MKYLLILGVLMSGPLFASGTDVEQEVKVISNPVMNAGSDSIAIGYGPDNDINDCMAHWSALIVTFPKRNKFCERQEFVSWAQAAQFHTPQSIKIMCSDPMGGEVFGSTLECISVFTPEGVPTTPPTPGPDEDGYRPDGAGEVSKCGTCRPPGAAIVETQLAIHTEEFEDLETRLARIERGNRIAAQKSQERRDYAQQTIQRLEDESEDE
jgi:hypothetical protein